MHLDSGDGAAARSLLDKYSSIETSSSSNSTSSSSSSSTAGSVGSVIYDTSIPFTFGRVLLEHVSLHILEEAGASQATVDAAIARGALYIDKITYIIMHNDSFVGMYINIIRSPQVQSLRDMGACLLRDVQGVCGRRHPSPVPPDAARTGIHGGGAVVRAAR